MPVNRVLRHARHFSHSDLWCQGDKQPQDTLPHLTESTICGILSYKLSCHLLRDMITLSDETLNLSYPLYSYNHFCMYCKSRGSTTHTQTQT